MYVRALATSRCRASAFTASSSSWSRFPLIGQKLRQVFRAHAVLARGGVQRLDARLDFAQRLRVQLDSRSILAQGTQRFVRLRFGRFQKLDHRFQVVVVRGERS